MWYEELGDGQIRCNLRSGLVNEGVPVTLRYRDVPNVSPRGKRNAALDRNTLSDEHSSAFE